MVFQSDRRLEIAVNLILDDIDDKLTLVGGSTAGIGFAIAKAFPAEGARAPEAAPACWASLFVLALESGVALP